MKFNGGREGESRAATLDTREERLTKANVRDLSVVGMLKGFDQLMNLVLDDVRELLRGRPSPLSSIFSGLFQSID